VNPFTPASAHAVRLTQNHWANLTGRQKLPGWA
jgi:hypothetical protein